MSVRGFTPVFDDIATKHGEVCALVFGRIWRYAQHPSGLCTASQQKIADRLGLHRSTVNKHIQTLVEAKDITDLDEGVRNKTHRLKPTKAWRFDVVAVGVDQNDTNVALDDTYVDESDMKIPVKDTKPKDIKKSGK